MELDDSETYLATGDVNGLVKVWNIASYCLDIDLNTKLNNEPRNLFFFLSIFLSLIFI